METTKKTVLDAICITAKLDASEAESQFFDRIPESLKEGLPPELEAALRAQFRYAFRVGANQVLKVIREYLNDLLPRDGRTMES